MDKDALRKEFLRLRNALTGKEAKAANRLVIRRLKADPAFKKAKQVLIYVSRGKEIGTHDLIKEISKEKEVYVPRVKGKTLQCVRFSSFEHLVKGEFGVLEPTKGKVVEVADIDLVVLPGLAFDKEGYRLGYGWGYFDTLLKGYQGRKVALAYSFQLVDSLPHDEWDVKVDEVITDTP
ncbi:MAG: 5-formyltetrahydrofolate cyclo-ligase [Nanoarchaeota archaeon]|nr:5-formyltetrahydrofolate cyclo-ligase [Nanoarchaeota archaeon]